VVFFLFNFNGKIGGLVFFLRLEQVVVVAFFVRCCLRFNFG